jgi:TPR repeat protein
LGFDHQRQLMFCKAWVRACLTLLWGIASAPLAMAQDSDRQDWLRNPAMGNYKAYAEFKMTHYAKAREVWETLAEVGNGDALFNLGVMAEDGLGEARDLAKAEALYTGAANGNNFKAQYRLGLLYSTGGLLNKDIAKARVYLTLASQHGDKDAWAMLTQLDDAGQVLTPLQQADLLSARGQHAQAAERYAALATQDDALAQTRLAWMYEAGRGVLQDLSEAARRFELAAHAGQAEAQYALAVMYQTGRGKARDEVLSMRWLQRSAAQNYPSALAAQHSRDALK